MNEREKWRVRVRDIRAGGTTWWWWWHCDTLTCRFSHIQNVRVDLGQQQLLYSKHESSLFLLKYLLNFIAYRSSKVSDCIFEMLQLWQSGFRRVYSNSCCSCSFKPEIIKIGQSFHKMYSNNILNFQESTSIVNAYTKKVWKLIVWTSYIYIYRFLYFAPFIHPSMI